MKQRILEELESALGSLMYERNMQWLKSPENIKLRKATKRIESAIKLIEESKMCGSKNPNSMCADCDCWKQTRKLCS